MAADLRALDWFLEAVPSDLANVLPVLAVPAVLTDEVAVQLLLEAGLPKDETERALRALHGASFVNERNSEWHVERPVREHLLDMIAPELAVRAHKLLIRISELATPEEAYHSVPGYLYEGSGRAYHLTALDVGRGLNLYRDSFRVLGELTGQQWLLAQLADEQQRRGVIGPQAIEPHFLLAMVHFREGRRAEALRLLRRVCESEETRIEVAIACHLVGQAERNHRESERLLRRSLKIGEDLGQQHHVAQVLHTLGDKLWSDRFTRIEAEQDLRQSLQLLEDLGDELGTAKVLHTLGQKLWFDQQRRGEAEALLRRSLGIGERLGHLQHQAQVLTTLGQKLWSDTAHRDEAEGYLRRSLNISENRKDRHSEAMALHTLGQKLWLNTSKREEAEKFLRRSLELLHDVGDRIGQIQVLNTMGHSFRASARWLEAGEAYQQAIALQPDSRNTAIAEEGLSYVAEMQAQDIPAAIEHLSRAISAQRQAGGERYVRQMEDRLRALKARLERR